MCERLLRTRMLRIDEGGVFARAGWGNGRLIGGWTSVRVRAGHFFDTANSHCTQENLLDGTVQISYFACASPLESGRKFKSVELRYVRYQFICL